MSNRVYYYSDFSARALLLIVRRTIYRHIFARFRAYQTQTQPFVTVIP